MSHSADSAPAPFRVAVAGLGTVGAATVQLLADNAGLIAARAGRPVEVVAVSARDHNRPRPCDLTGIAWFGDATEMAARAECDAVVELIGGSEGVARAVTEAAIKAGRPVVSANKALFAHHGWTLAQAAEAAGVPLAFEAAVAGGIPILKALREGLAANALDSVYGLLNGTCNYILSTMRDSGRDFADVLAEAQSLGYAEADPSFDVDGVDAAHKLAILTSLAFGTQVNLDAVHVEGIREITALDIAFAEELGYRIKLLGLASATEAGIEQRVHPTMIPADAPLAGVDGVFNAVVAEGDAVGRVVLEGPGAGAGPTASAVVADLIDLAAGRTAPPFGLPAAHLRPLDALPVERRRGSYYVRLTVLDRPGVFADIAAILYEEEVSMESILQRGRNPGDAVPVVMTLHDTIEAAARRAVDRIAQIEAVVETPVVIRIEHL
ncbi:homoserine dehydrogenase [Roseospirillum parvum]|uniref:Homoserine dehydrogenase n=1 Tax=Roseospirillum parvum TaxID=83401 RepID=A0A1G8ASW3_9PROT|nr:homoserine dehydrogenase [Roseospirillum parvum]SDH24027.1 homoserine dehydrogenase [Roseospirillum parvum]